MLFECLKSLLMRFSFFVAFAGRFPGVATIAQRLQVIPLVELTAGRHRRNVIHHRRSSHPARAVAFPAQRLRLQHLRPELEPLAAAIPGVVAVGRPWGGTPFTRSGRCGYPFGFHRSELRIYAKFAFAIFFFIFDSCISLSRTNGEKNA